MRVAFDTGGTFTDCVYVHRGRLQIIKVPSTPRKPSQAIVDVLNKIRASLGHLPGLELVCGTTVGTNALLQKRAAGWPW